MFKSFKQVSFFLVISLAILSLSCSKSVTLTRLTPAPINVPSSVQTIVIVDRTKPQNEMVNVIEGLITGEMPFEVRNSIEATLATLQQQLNTSPRYQIKRANQRLTGGMFGQVFPQPLDWFTIERLCEQYQADAVLALENFNSDFITTEKEAIIKKTVGEGKDAQTVEVKGLRLEGVANVSAGFRLYDPQNKTIVDQQRFQKTNTWTAEAETKTQALAMLIAKADATRIVGELAGSGYAYKIAPMFVSISRDYFRKSKTQPALENGNRFAEVGKWEEAIQTWEEGVVVADYKTSAKLLYNIAVGYEVLGSLHMAHDYASQAYTQYGLKKGRNYAQMLSAEIRNQELLENQMRVESK